MNNFERMYLCLLAAIREIEARLEDGDSESALSISKAAQIAVKSGINSPELYLFRPLNPRGCLHENRLACNLVPALR